MNFFSTLRWSSDLGTLGLLGVFVLSGLTLGLLLLEQRERAIAFRGRGLFLFLSGIFSVVFLGLAVLRPVVVDEEKSRAGARVLVLVDGSERLGLPAGAGKSRGEVRDDVLRKLKERFRGARVNVLRFGDDLLLPETDQRVLVESDGNRAVEAALKLPGERPGVVVVVSDGRMLESGGATPPTAAIRAMSRVDAVQVAAQTPHDQSIRQVTALGVAVAHEPFPIQVKVGCAPGDPCPKATVIVNELLEGAEPKLLGRAEVDPSSGEDEIEVSIVLERAGRRLIEVSFESPRNDDVPENDRHLVPIEVRRDRIRILHVGGHPTYDVRALRSFLKSDESIDLIAFFILRTLTDRVGASESELSLIPFPVEELFTEHLPSFDAIILQDIDAVEYGLARHFPALKRYVLDGGGLIVVGGSESFGRGGYAESPLADVLPVELPVAKSFVSEAPFVPAYTLIGRRAPMLAPLRKLHGERLPEMGGTNLVGSARPAALVLWEHPSLGAVRGTTRMPILALGEFGDGRSIALTVDATHKLKFGPLAAASSGRGHSALWEGLLGWLMRDARFEAADVVPDAPCAAGRPLTLRGSLLSSSEATLRLQLRELSAAGAREPAKSWSAPGALDRPARFSVGSLPRGGYVARVDADGAPPSRFVFPCEVAAGAFRDSRPDTDHLRRLVEPYGGGVFAADEVGKLPEPPEALVVTKSQSRPWLPPWVWSSLAAVCLGLHFWWRRSEGLL